MLSVTEIIKKIKRILKKPKIIIALGVAGILLIFVSSNFSEKSENNTQKFSVDCEEYKNEIEENVKEITSSISGDKNPTVVVTLENSVRYTYADTGESDNTKANGGNTTQESEKNKRSYITVKDSNGGEKALIVTESMPQIRGVAIICSGGDSEEIREKIQNAVLAALNITSKRVYISGGN